MNYNEFIESKSRSIPPSGFAVDDIHPKLFDFQRVIVKWALARGRAAIFADTGLGKTFMQVEWARHIANLTSGRVLILAPLAVAQQTVQEAAKLDITVRYCRSDVGAQITITNYEMMDHFDLSQFSGIVLDESSILKHHDSKTRERIITGTGKIPYRLSCTATPSPNDFMELGNQAEFLGVMSRMEMLAQYFTHDSGETSKWRLKGHGRERFWAWMSTWAVVIGKPSDIGFDDQRFELPPLVMHEHVVTSDNMFNGELFPKAAQTLQEQRQAQRASIDDRVSELAGMVNASDETWLIWCHLNDESAMLKKLIPGSVEVKGADKPEHKEQSLIGFANGEIRVLISKPRIAGFGMNFQVCHKVAFVGLSHSFEQFYQAIRRCWRFGQTEQVDAHLFTAESEGQVLASLKAKERAHAEMKAQMAIYMGDLMKQEIQSAKPERTELTVDTATGEGWVLHLNDCVDAVHNMDSDSIDYTVFSPPFSSLYTYSNSDRDMGNSRDDNEFYRHFGFLIDDLYRVTKPGRLLSFHCMNLPSSKQNHGYIGLRDFRGELIKLFTDRGWIFASEVCIWKDPVVAMQRTKALGLLYKQLKKDSVMSRQGIPDYLVTMRKPGENPEPVTKDPDTFPVGKWQKYASPIWTDINQSRTLNYREARENDDERHICPLQLDVIERCIELWSNPGDTVLSPFAGVGSEGYVAIQMGRGFVGVELKRSYFEIAVKNLKHARIDQGEMFA